MALIDIGPGALDRAGQINGELTYIDLANPANDTGTITSFELWFVNNATDVKVGTFSGSGTSYTSRDYETIGSVTAGSKQTFSGLDIDVVTGDFAGFYFNAGDVESNNSGGSGVYKKLGDQFGQGAQTYELYADWVISIYGTGTTITPGVGAQYINISPFGVTIFGGKTN